jgi:hypothetical protein
VPDWPGIGRSGHIRFEEMTGEKVEEGLSGLIREIGKPLVLLTTRWPAITAGAWRNCMPIFSKACRRTAMRASGVFGGAMIGAP